MKIEYDIPIGEHRWFDKPNLICLHIFLIQSYFLLFDSIRSKQTNRLVAKQI